MHVAIIGFAREGQAAFRYWNELGADITVCDLNEHTHVPAEAESQLGADYLKGLDRFDVIVRSAGIHPKRILEANPEAPTLANKITTSVNEFLRVCPTKNVIGVTGSKGKGTTSTLITRILTAAGHTVHLGGNIGIAPLELLTKGISAEDWVVLELSSFQLYDIQRVPHIGVCLMLVPEHLDWHSDTTDYYNAKGNLFRLQNAGDVAIYYADDEQATALAQISPGSQIPYMRAPGAYVDAGQVMINGQVICTVNDVTLPGEHNLQNICAAVTTAWSITQDVDAIGAAVTSFNGLPHRLEYVGTIDGARYYNDSLGTIPRATVAAIKAFREPVVLVLGGSDKGTSFDELGDALEPTHVRHAVIIGETGPKIAALIDAQPAERRVPYTRLEGADVSMTQIVAVLRAQAQAGDAVLLAPACASYDMFASYQDRGDQFRSVVQGLAKAESQSPVQAT